MHRPSSQLLHDCLGNPLNLDDPASLPAVNAFIEGFLACEARAVEVLHAADDGSALVQACCAALHMFAESAQAPALARPFMHRAQAALARASDRERRFVAAVAAWVDGDLPRAIALHEEQARLHPRDLASLKLGQYHLFNLGDSPGMLRLALHALPHAADVPHLHGMAAFAWEQCHLLPQAEAAARQALRLSRREPWAQHALAHVMLTQGRLREGRAFMREASPLWTGLNSFMVTHNWWHLALFELELGDTDEALRLYDQQVWGVDKGYSQDQVNAVSLLARLELAGVDVGTRWHEVAEHLARRLEDQVLPFLDLQYLYGLARAGRSEAAALLERIEVHARQAQGSMKAVWQEVAAPAARGLWAHARGDAPEAARLLGQALPRMVEIGGSHAQRDLFAQIHLDAQLGSQQLSGAQNQLQPQWNQQPESWRLARLAGKLYTALGLPEVVATRPS
ncbi:MAG: tetratricopeptide repeat protein [Curvibacter sp.]|nr:tetratricopeptide repeat protein [Curvibacter sp.]